MWSRENVEGPWKHSHRKRRGGWCRDHTQAPLHGQPEAGKSPRVQAKKSEQQAGIQSAKVWSGWEGCQLGSGVGRSPGLRWVTQFDPDPHPLPSPAGIMFPNGPRWQALCNPALGALEFRLGTQTIKERILEEAAVLLGEFQATAGVAQRRKQGCGRRAPRKHGDPSPACTHRGLTQPTAATGQHRVHHLFCGLREVLQL